MQNMTCINNKNIVQNLENFCANSAGPSLAAALIYSVVGFLHVCLALKYFRFNIADFCHRIILGI